MNIYLVKRKYPCDYDEFDAFVAIAESEKEAILMDPSNGGDYGWTSAIKTLECIELGKSKTKRKRIVLASFNAG
jgi:hypothetical protein